VRARVRLVVPAELAYLVSRWGPSRLSPSRRLAFIGPAIVEEGAELEAVLEDMTTLSVVWLRAHPGYPAVRDVARYVQETAGNDYLALPVTLGLYDADYVEAVGRLPQRDCEDLSIADAAEERVRGNHAARPAVLYVSEHMRHIVTDLGAGRVRDLSRILIFLHGSQGTV
jgi:hypothetical protein